MKFIIEHKINGKKLSLVQGDITERDVDAIVNEQTPISSTEAGLQERLSEKAARLFRRKVMQSDLPLLGQQ
jgi:O-acetyl-ADP-ribose deacetylase (regulator of RNase III)